MAIQKIGLTGNTWGIPSEETGINVESFTETVKPEINEKFPGIDGQVRGRVLGDPEGELTIEGEINNTTGVMAIAIGTAFVPINSTTYFGRSTGGWYFDEGTVTNARGALKKVSVKLSSNTGLA